MGSLDELGGDAASGDVDVAIVGAGAAGLATAIRACEARPHARVWVLDGARTIGAKILVSGGGRCNVTNRHVSERDYWGGDRRFTARVLRAFPASRAVDWFAALGVSCHEERDGKLFPDSNSARTVLDALVARAEALGVRIVTGARVVDVRATDSGFTVEYGDGRVVRASRVVLATGGRSLPKSGSDGGGYALAARLGHACVPTTPALVPLVLDGTLHAALAGVSHPAALGIRRGGRTTWFRGSLLWTHFGMSGPVVLDASRHWLRARLEGDPVAVTLNVLDGESFEVVEQWLRDAAATHPRATIRSTLARRLPASVADAWLTSTAVDPTVTMAHLSRDDRRRLVSALTAWPLDVRESRGWAAAEATAGGVPTTEVDPATMESTRCPGLFLVGEILDVDGRLGGFNFQWAWSSAWVAGRGVWSRL